ncbi:hypothetical protein DS745_10665 [Anaerobacillus alkaliphilus]|uniref:SHOCT domain-containing protein n=1 Tax=Anaerobacillus alkaliphilus TaxID=1548597 RepID=A0A4Q0VSN9_9BACI|nr:hypothetical protein [Anaerobacillus alkaliphilus]RXJ01120.1 hypothetical protein DS745_10665 [Anaerobacillus alkaliphilus]
MKKIVRGFVLLVTILLLQLTILPANEALSDKEAIVLTELNIKIMPEFINPENWDYNIPSLLVGYHGTFTNHSETPYSGEIKVSVPTHLPNFQPSFIAQFQGPEDSAPIEENYTVNVQEGYISWTPQNEIGPNENYYFVLEYFSAPIEGVVDRSFAFEYVAETPINNLNIAVYAPYKARNFQIDKEADLGSMTFGLEFFMYEYTEITVGEVYDLHVSYTKEDIVTTMDALNDFSAPNDETHASFKQPELKQDSGFFNAENIILLSLAIVFVGGFVFMIVRKNKQPNDNAKEKIQAPKKIVNKEEELKKIRKLLADGQIDENTYKEKRAKLG